MRINTFLMTPFKKVKKMCNYAFRWGYSKIDHVRYMKHIGVNLGRNVNIYGDPLEMFSTEPWAISLGNNVQITREVIFITHGGGYIAI